MGKLSNMLNEEIQERIKADADKLYPLFLQADTKAGYIAGATAENTRFQPILDALDQFISFHESGLLPAKHVYEKAIAARQQWKEGKDKEKYEGSVFSEPALGITLGCISPEARELLDTIMEAWEKHYADMKEMHKDAMPKTTLYGFAYWLVRWSGLIQPTNINPPK